MDLYNFFTFIYSFPINSFLLLNSKAVERILHDAHSKLQVTLSERQSLREQKLLLECLMKIPMSLDNLEKLLNLTISETINSMLEDDPNRGNVIGRAANEYNQLQHLMMKCNSAPLMVSDIQKVQTDKQIY